MTDTWAVDDHRVYPVDRFNAVWETIKGWDIQRTPGQGYASATGTDVADILDALEALS